MGYRNPQEDSEDGFALEGVGEDEGEGEEARVEAVTTYLHLNDQMKPPYCKSGLKKSKSEMKSMKRWAFRGYLRVRKKKGG